MNYRFTLLILLFTFSGFAQDQNVLDVQRQLEKLSSDEFQGRLTGTTGRDLAADYIVEHLRDYDLKPYFEAYKDTFYLKNNTLGINVIAQVEGTEAYLKNNPLVISAHYDHIGFIKPVENDSIGNGANDNASGSVGVLQLAKLLKDKKPLRPILFILFDAEEQGLLGSKYLAEKMKSLDIEPYAIFNIEMIGVPMRNKPQKAYITGHGMSNFVDYFNEIAGDEALMFLPTAKKYNLFRRSDNYPFYQSMNIPAHSVSTFDFVNYKYYHQVQDEAELMDAQHIYDLVKIWAPVLEEIANHEEPIIKLNN
jgi:Zn-dependent M28 family amino/carboxypeptidase